MLWTLYTFGRRLLAMLPRPAAMTQPKEIAMPITMDCPPVEVSLVWDQKKPTESRPVLLARHMSCRTSRDYCRLLGEAAKASDAADFDKADELLDTALQLTIVGTRNFPQTTVKEVLDDALTTIEKWEIAYGLLGALAEDYRQRTRPEPAKADQAQPA